MNREMEGLQTEREGTSMLWQTTSDQKAPQQFARCHSDLEDSRTGIRIPARWPFSPGCCLCVTVPTFRRCHSISSLLSRSKALSPRAPATEFSTVQSQDCNSQFDSLTLMPTTSPPSPPYCTLSI